MGARNGVAGWPTWVLNIGAMIDEGIEVRAGCTVCRAWSAIDLSRLVALKGRDYSLINRRSRCRFTSGCRGWVRFTYPLGVYRPLWDEATSQRWDAYNRREAAREGGAELAN